ncbi:DnaJ domain-containing protein [Candidatus Pelagibacter sp.]|nr:DnaJ domain-containing protein [Candidatus Pelagibacter sp.]
MNIIIYTVLILAGLYFLLRYLTRVASKKISKALRILLFIILAVFAVLFAIGGKVLLTLPLTLASLALLKLKGLSIFQLISLYRLIQTLRNSGRFSFNNQNPSNLSTMSTQEAYRILNLNPSKSLTKEEVNKAYIKIQKKIHPDISPETSRLSSLVNEAKEIVLRDIA